MLHYQMEMESVWELTGFQVVKIEHGLLHVILVSLHQVT